MRNDHLRVRVCLTLVLLSLFLSAPASILGNWGLEVGRANADDVTNLAKDWNSYRRERVLLDWQGETVLVNERQRQLLGEEFVEGLGPQQLFLKTQDAFLTKIMGPLQRIALNPAASCPEAQFALATMMGMRRQQQLLGLDESASINVIYKATEGMAALRCRDEALDECVATGRFTQILDLMMASDRQADMMGRVGGDKSWAEDALSKCAIYELHFVSRTKFSDKGPVGPVEVETVRDGKVKIQFEIPEGGLMSLVRTPLGDALKGKTGGANPNPFFVSVKCTFPQPPGAPLIQFICSPGADSAPIKVRINALDLRHREFYLDTATSKYSLRDFSRERIVGEDKFSFEFEGGDFSLEGLLKIEGETVPVPLPYVGVSFYMAHTKDQIAPPSDSLKIERIKRGVYPAVFQFTYEDKGTDDSGILFTDSTEFELIHKPKPDPFRKPPVPEPIRKPLKPPPG